MQLSLKDQNLPALVLVIALHVAGYVLIGSGLAFKQLLTAISEHLELLLALPLSLVVGLLNAQVGPISKARIVFLRWHNPLPGSFAFSKIMHTDPRIDISALQKLEGQLPEDPVDQNRRWYKLYQSVQNEPQIRQVQRSYLLYRDWCTIVALLFPAMTGLAFWQVDLDGALICAAIVVVEYLLVGQAARVHGERFVASVLAVVITRPESETE